MDALQRIIDGKIDFQGQRLADRIGQETIALFAVLGFVAGYATQSLQLLLLVYGAGVVIALTASVPPWPMYNRYPVTWLPSTKQQSQAAVSSSSSSSQQQQQVASKS
ncbi:hypothetical protein OC842_004706 [Tilletia horrida]|uniref:Signal peptidase complex subunit 1 n=1 Tax=Tilletia horrida TaxID=155126 RepID=A0AAN6GDT1_9BASI|nr:hypothetical protein OC842_004706 [Tilletia horrida]